MVAAITIAAITGVAAKPLSAIACPQIEFDGDPAPGPEVACGHTPSGALWEIEAGHNNRFIHTQYFVDGKGGGGTSVIARHGVFGLYAYNDIYSRNEPYVQGLVGAEAASLQVAMGDGTAVTVRPTLASQRWRQRFAWLRPWRFFWSYYSAGLRPTAITALDRNGGVLCRAAHPDHGVFFDCATRRSPAEHR